jgi:valyl-tRNA synthetase
MSEAALSVEALAKKAKNEEKNEAKRKEKMEKFEAKKKLQAEKLAKAAPKAAKKTTSAVELPKFVNSTVEGDLKDFTGMLMFSKISRIAPMEASYDPERVEASWYSWWEKNDLFKPDPNATETYTIPIPPPNVTGSLHLGHGLTVAIQDCMIRWNRMKGKSVLYVPGLDHAGIATQIVVEKRIFRETGQTRHDIGREDFIKEVWKWKEQYGDRIYKQLRGLGTSADWSRSTFTMDPKMVVAVNEAFVRLHEDGTIYRENRLVIATPPC